MAAVNEAERQLKMAMDEIVELKSAHRTLRDRVAGISLLLVLFCFVLFCFVLFCFVLFCFVLFCFVLFCFVFVLFFGILDSYFVLQFKILMKGWRHMTNWRPRLPSGEVCCSLL